MTPMDKSKWLVQIVRRVESDARAEYVRARVEQASHLAAASVWQEENPNDGVGGMSGNPYATEERDKAHVDSAIQRHTDATELVDFVINRIIETGEKS